MGLLPLMIVAAAVVAAMLGIAFSRNHLATLMVTLAGLGLATASLPAVLVRVQGRVLSLVVLDRYGFLYMGLLFAASFVAAVLAYGYLKRRPEPPEEYYVLLLLATLGGAVLTVSRHFASLFLGLEILSVSLYAMIAYRYSRARSLEAGIKYLILAGVSSAFLLFGMAMVYAELGAMDFVGLAGLAGRSAEHTLPGTAGLAMMMVGVGFKLAVVPFHLWTADVYEGAPAPVTAFVATVSKGAVFALLLRMFADVHGGAAAGLMPVFALIAVASMLAGNLLALLQENVKRILAYSSIAHLGYLLVAFLVGGRTAASAVTAYLVVYFVTTLAAFGVITVLSGEGREPEALEDYRGLVWRRPFLGGAFTAALLSLAGIPLTAGFVGKFHIIAAGVEASLWLPVAVLVASSAIGLFYYLRVVAIMYMHPGAEVGGARGLSGSLAGGVALAALALLLVWLGVYPAPLMELIEASARVAG